MIAAAAQTPAAPAAPAKPAFFVGKCMRCKVPARFEAPVTRTFVAQLGYGRTERRTWRAAPWGVVEANRDGSLSVGCLCGGRATFNQVLGHVTKTKCDTRCTGATGHSCECSCGGRNHGADHGGAS